MCATGTHVPNDSFIGVRACVNIAGVYYSSVYLSPIFNRVHGTKRVRALQI